MRYLKFIRINQRKYVFHHEKSNFEQIRNREKPLIFILTLYFILMLYFNQACNMNRELILCKF